MNSQSDPQHEITALRARISALSAACLRIGSSLDFGTVLNEVAESARSLTGASYAAIVTIDGAGVPVDFVTSGFTNEEHRAIAEWSEGPGLFEHVRDLEGPLRIADLPGHVRALGLSPDVLPWGSVLGAPMRSRGVHVGNFYLINNEGTEDFTGEDEEILLLFASQAAAAIDNARTYRAELKARTDLEVLIETSPVGVVVFEAATGSLTSVNREARRLVDHLQTPGRMAEDLLEVLTVRFADGREIALNRLPLATAFSTGETMRAEEIELSTPEGNSVTTLVNATPILAEDGRVISVVVTMQDLAPLQELERIRSSFLGMVSRELRTPLAAIKGSAATVLGAPASFAEEEKRQFFRIIEEQADRMSSLIGDLLDAGRIEAGTLSVVPEPTEVVALMDDARSTFLPGGSGHSIIVDLPADLPPVLVDRRRIVQVLSILLEYSARHASESTPIRIAAKCEGVHVAISILDEGRSITPGCLSGLFRKYARDSNASDGLGLTICKGLVEAHGGRIRVESAGPGKGTHVTFTIPVAEPAAAEGSPSGTARHPASSHIRETRATPVLVVDDDPLMLRYLRDTLVDAGYAPLVATDHKDLAPIIQAENPRLVLLDLMLPGTDGIELMRAVPELADLPVIIISGYGRDETIARALEAGADDYIVKPFSPTELTARIRAALRRRALPDLFVSGDLAIDYGSRKVSVDDRPIALTAREFGVLRVLSQGEGRITTYDTLLRRVWNRRGSGDPAPVRAVVKRLRRKLGDKADDPTWILNERGVGYRMRRTPGPQRTDSH